MTFDLKSWIAGIWEGEGCINNSVRYKNNRYPRIMFYNNDITMLLKIKDFFPEGIIYERKYGKNHKTPNANPNYMMNINKKIAIERFMKEIAPLVQSKNRKEQLRRY